MRNICLFLNFLLIGLVFWLVIGSGKFPSPTEKDFWVAVVFLAAPILNIYYFMYIHISSSENNWFGLYLKRKILEEKQKIDQLNNSNKSLQ